MLMPPLSGIILTIKPAEKIIDSDAEVFVFVALNVQNMTKAPKRRQANNGKYLPNDTAAKTVFIEAILESACATSSCLLSTKQEEYRNL